MLSASRGGNVAKRFFKKVMRAEHRRLSLSISVDKNAAYPEALNSSQAERVVPQDCKLRRVKYLNYVIEQNHRFIKKKVRASQCFKRFHTAERAHEGIQAVNMMRKGRSKGEWGVTHEVMRNSSRGCSGLLLSKRYSKHFRA